MIFACDEDVGTRIPRALNLVGLSTLSFRDTGLLGVPDVHWLAEAGAKRWFIFSCNKAMLDIAIERDTIVREKVGIVFLTSGQERLSNTLRLILAKWEWFEFVDSTIARPFAFLLYPTGRTKRII